jgi:hypothetical protein
VEGLRPEIPHGRGWAGDLRDLAVAELALMTAFVDMADRGRDGTRSRTRESFPNSGIVPEIGEFSPKPAKVVISVGFRSYISSCEMAMIRNRKRLDPYWAPYVISGRGIAEGHNNEGTAKFAFGRRSRGFPAGLIILWERSPDRLRYDRIDWYRFKHRPL